MQKVEDLGHIKIIHMQKDVMEMVILLLLVVLVHMQKVWELSLLETVVIQKVRELKL